MKLIGVGFGRTGTLSLKEGLEQIGVGPCFHMLDLIQGENRERDLPYWVKIANGEPVDWDEVFEPWQSTVDWPACRYWRELMDHFPDAPLLLNVRDFDGWYESVKNTIHAAKVAAMAGHQTNGAEREMPSPELWGVIEKIVWQGDLQGRFEDREFVRDLYHERIEMLKREIPEERLIVWELGVDGWEPICEKLGIDVPDTPFPRTHSTNEFRTDFGLQPV